MKFKHGDFIKRKNSALAMFTAGKVYKLDANLRINDDTGVKWKPSPENEIDWELLPLYNADICKYKYEGLSLAYREFLSKGEKKMVKVENVVLINNKRATEYTEDELIRMLEQETENITRLDNLCVVSAAIEAIKDRHENNIAEILLILGD